MRLALLKLSCVNCSAPLDVGDDLERFACMYCGTTQIVQRAGGTVALKKVESAIHAVQRGTDRTAAELAIPRLNKELAEAQTERLLALKAEKEKMAKAYSGRTKLTLIVFIVFMFLGVMGAGLFVNAPALIQKLYPFVWLGSCVGVPVWVYRKVKLPRDNTRDVLAPFDARITKIEEQLRANRAILDSVSS